MRLLLVFLVLSTRCSIIWAQGSTQQVFPWNPDANFDNAVGASDILATLAVYGNQIISPSPGCTYEGTTIEEVLLGPVTGEVVIDSMFVAFSFESISTYYLFGCPEPITDTLTFGTSAMLTNFNSTSTFWEIDGMDPYGAQISFKIWGDASSNAYGNDIQIYALESLGFVDDGFFGSRWGGFCDTSIPFPGEWSISEGGLNIPMCWGFSDQLTGYQIIPFWHFAE